MSVCLVGQQFTKRPKIPVATKSVECSRKLQIMKPALRRSMATSTFNEAPRTLDAPRTQSMVTILAARWTLQCSRASADHPDGRATDGAVDLVCCRSLTAT